MRIERSILSFWTLTVVEGAWWVHAPCRAHQSVNTNVQANKNTFYFAGMFLVPQKSHFTEPTLVVVSDLCRSSIGPWKSFSCLLCSGSQYQCSPFLDKQASTHKVCNLRTACSQSLLVATALYFPGSNWSLHIQHNRHQTREYQRLPPAALEAYISNTLIAWNLLGH